MSQRLPDAIFHIYFSPYTGHALEIDGVVYPTIEHAYQCARYDNSEIRKEIREASSAVNAWKTSCKYKDQQKEGFRERKFETMKSFMRIKLEQHEDVKNALQESGNQIIVKHIISGPPGDGVWDDGADRLGENRMGKMWMELRDEIQ